MPDPAVTVSVLNGVTPSGAQRFTDSFVIGRTRECDHFGLHVGPLHAHPVYDPQDERFESTKATLAASRYLKMLNNTDAQASGLLVMAAYNWGEGNVQKYLDRMPPNPRERNFWRLLSIKNIPKETYDYVYSVFSAAVICQDPKLFGFDCSCPVYPGADLPVLQGAGSRAM
jgi:membrane-bound lytic murein transglycosylase D